jgi:hypothetical protein
MQKKKKNRKKKRIFKVSCGDLKAGGKQIRAKPPLLHK